MTIPLPEQLKTLADACPEPLYAVGGCVRDFLLGYAPADFDLASPMSDAVFADAARTCGFEVKAVYGRTGTVKIASKDVSAEFTRFRTDSYEHGVHAPQSVSFTRDMTADALRRDFTANAVYYDIGADRLCDPLHGVEDIRAGQLKMTREDVFCEDGLRLLRLARIAAETGLISDETCIQGAKNNASLIRDIAPERIFHELELLLDADQKHGLKDGPYRGLTLLKETGVLHEVLPELALGEGMEQRKDFHAYDVLEHSFRCVLYAPPEIRFAALLHDVGKPFCRMRDGNTYAHAAEGARIAGEILRRLKAPNRLISDTCALVGWHMLDLKGDMREAKVRRCIAEIGPLLEPLFLLKQADFSACKDDCSIAPFIIKWRKILDKMQAEGAPCTLREMKIGGNDLIALGIPPTMIGKCMAVLFDECLLDGTKNTHDRLLTRAAAFVQES